MKDNYIYNILERIKNNDISVDEAYQQLKVLPYEDLGFAKLDHHRAIRDNFPEVVYCEGKTSEQLKLIFTRLARINANILGTRASLSAYDAVAPLVPGIEYDSTSRLLHLKRAATRGVGRVTVMSAGTADLPVAEEAAIALEVMGGEVQRIYDVGVAGIHRILDKISLINESRVIIVVAGMEGALASVVGGLTSRPVIAVPTSVGYGASFQGLAALLAMLNSCASGIGVVNIDNGYGAAALAFSILNNQVDSK